MYASCKFGSFSQINIIPDQDKIIHDNVYARSQFSAFFLFERIFTKYANKNKL